VENLAKVSKSKLDFEEGTVIKIAFFGYRRGKKLLLELYLILLVLFRFF
jgi:hypothetical protein